MYKGVCKVISGKVLKAKSSNLFNNEGRAFIPTRNQNEYNYKKEAEDENHCFKLGHYEERERENEKESDSKSKLTCMQINMYRVFCCLV